MASVLSTDYGVIVRSFHVSNLKQPQRSDLRFRIEDEPKAFAIFRDYISTETFIVGWVERISARAPMFGAPSNNR